MKTILYIFIFSIGAISFAQDPQLFENDWYLHSINIESIDYYPPNLEPIQFREHVFTENPYVFYTGYCDAIAPSVIYNQDNSFLLEDSPTIVPGSFCSFPENDTFNNQYFSIFYTSDMLAKNVFSYTITSDGNNKALQITNPNGDEARYGDAPLTTEDFGSTPLSIHPNPVLNQLFLNSNNISRKLNIKIFNIEGKLLIEQDLNFEKTSSIDVSNLSGGIYFLNLSDENGNVEIKKFIKE